MKDTIYAALVGIVFGIIFGLVMITSHNYKVTYANEHNCRWDYNDMCYTYEQRPWLFNEGANND